MAAIWLLLLLDAILLLQLTKRAATNSDSCLVFIVSRNKTLIYYWNGLTVPVAVGTVCTVLVAVCTVPVASECQIFEYSNIFEYIRIFSPEYICFLNIFIHFLLAEYIWIFICIIFSPPNIFGYSFGLFSVTHIYLNISSDYFELPKYIYGSQPNLPQV